MHIQFNLYFFFLSLNKIQKRRGEHHHQHFEIFSITSDFAVTVSAFFFIHIIWFIKYKGKNVKHKKLKKKYSNLWIVVKKNEFVFIFLCWFQFLFIYIFIHKKY
jgi:hypothetical protein